MHSCITDGESMGTALITGKVAVSIKITRFDTFWPSSLTSTNLSYRWSIIHSVKCRVDQVFPHVDQLSFEIAK